MIVPALLQFEFNGQPLRFPTDQLASVTSPFTGRQLRKLMTTVTLEPMDAARVKEFLATAPVMDSGGSLWTGSLDTEAYSNGGPHNLTITWSESEILRAEMVEFAGLSLRPLAPKYEEHVNTDGSIGINFQAALTKEETERLRSLSTATRTEVQYWPVIRRGITDEPRSMRLGRVLWQSLDSGQIAHDITLVDEAFDSSEASNAFLALGGEPRVGNLIREVSSLIVQFEALLAELEATAAITPEAIQRVRASADALGALRAHIFFEVDDLSRW
jgi:hypothetical protein